LGAGVKRECCPRVQLKAGQVCTYTMDGVGNLKTMWEGGSFPKTFSFDAADRLVTMMEGADLTTYAWTGYGALASETIVNKTTTYSYSGQDQLIGVLDPSGVRSTYTFDGDGMRRAAQEGNVQPTTMVWDGSDYLYLKKPGNQSQVVLTLDSEIVACGTKDLLTDPLGSLVREISAGASLSSLVELYPYGQRVRGTGATTTPFVYICAYGYYTDSAERDYVRARELYKKVGRWMQLDLFWPETEPYSYADNKPLDWPDPSGGEPQFQNCSDDIKKRVKRMCWGLKWYFSEEQRMAVNKCIKDASGIIGWWCGPITLNRRWCINAWCTNLGRFVCDPSLDAAGKCPGTPWLYEDRELPSSTIIYRPGAPGSNYAYPEGSPLEVVFLHELMHACGETHNRSYDEFTQCNDILACCLYEVIRGRSRGQRCVARMPRPRIGAPPRSGGKDTLPRDSGGSIRLQ
jgi:RHS repeat-associated protein